MLRMPFMLRQSLCERSSCCRVALSPCRLVGLVVSCCCRVVLSDLPVVLSLCRVVGLPCRVVGLPCRIVGLPCRVVAGCIVGRVV
jgi:hypothetical protein